MDCVPWEAHPKGRRLGPGPESTLGAWGTHHRTPHFLRNSVTKRFRKRELWHPSLAPSARFLVFLDSAGLPWPLQQGHTT